MKKNMKASMMRMSGRRQLGQTKQSYHKNDVAVNVSSFYLMNERKSHKGNNKLSSNREHYRLIIV
jgi:hypothetical protein